MTLAPASPDRREGATLPWFAGIRPQTISRYFAPLWVAPTGVDPRSTTTAPRKDTA